MNAIRDASIVARKRKRIHSVLLNAGAVVVFFLWLTEKAASP